MSSNTCPEVAVPCAGRDAYRPEVDGLRAIAVLAVVLYHFNQDFLRAGYLGVDMFFVISGYVITSSLAKQNSRTLRDFLAGFYSRRIKRLLPALILCIFVTSLVATFFVPHSIGEYQSSLKAGAAALFGASNLYYFYQAADYFSPSVEYNLFTQTWSLGVEEQFYLLFPALFWFGRAKSGGRPLPWILGALGAASLLAFVVLSIVYPDAAYYLMPTRFWELCTGCLVCIAERGLAARLPAKSGWVALVIIAVALLAPAEFQTAATIAAVAATAVLIITMSPGTAVHRVMSARPVVEVGRMSYSIYLWHWSVLSLSRWTIGLDVRMLPLQMLAVFGIAALSYYYVEKPLRYRTWSRRPLGTIARGLAVACASVVFLIVLLRPAFAVLYVGQRASIKADDPTSLLQPRITRAGRVWTPQSCLLSSTNLEYAAVSFERCTLPPKSGAHRRILVIGNSFSVAEFDMYTALTDADLGSVTLVAAAGVPAAPMPPPQGESTAVTSPLWNGIVGRLFDRQQKRERSAVATHYWRDVVPSLFDRLERGDIVVMVNDLSRRAPQQADAESERRLALFGQGVRRMSADLARKGVSVVFQSGLPFIGDSHCNPDSSRPQWYYPGGKSPCRFYSRTETFARYAGLRAVLTAIERSNPKFHTLDLMPVFCPGATCSFDGAEGEVLYRDAYGHPSIEAAIRARPLLLAAVRAAIKDKDSAPTPLQRGRDPN